MVVAVEVLLVELLSELWYKALTNPKFIIIANTKTSSALKIYKLRNVIF